MSNESEFGIFGFTAAQLIQNAHAARKKGESEIATGILAVLLSRYIERMQGVSESHSDLTVQLYLQLEYRRPIDLKPQQVRFVATDLTTEENVWIDVPLDVFSSDAMVLLGHAVEAAGDVIKLSKYSPDLNGRPASVDAYHDTFGDDSAEAWFNEHYHGDLTDLQALVATNVFTQLSRKICR